MAACIKDTSDLHILFGPEVAMHICATTEGKAAAVIQVQLALCAAAAVERHHLGPSITTTFSTPFCKPVMDLWLTQIYSEAEQTWTSHCVHALH